MENVIRAILAVGSRNHVADSRMMRDVDFVSVDHKPDGCTFRFPNLRDAKDDSSGETYDWWLHVLRQAVKENPAQAKHVPPTRVRVYLQTTTGEFRMVTEYEGGLDREGAAGPRLCRDNSGLIEFGIHGVTKTVTMEPAVRVESLE